MFKRAVLELGKPEGAVLYNLNAFGAGPAAVLDRISKSQSGIYAWFRSYEFRNEPKLFADDLIQAICAPKFQSRRSQIPPYHEIDLRSKSYISSSRESQIRLALERPQFYEAIKYALDWSLLFQAPLYVGKSVDLRARIKQHLGSDSILRARLAEASIDIDRSYLLVVPMTLSAVELDVECESSSELDSTELTESEVLFEEIFSRLFNPSFSIRIG